MYICIVFFLSFFFGLRHGMIMDANEIFHFRLSDSVDHQLRGPTDHTDNSISNFSVLASTVLVLSCFLLVCKLKQHWYANARCSFCNCIAEVWKQGVNRWFCSDSQCINVAKQAIKDQDCSNEVDLHERQKHREQRSNEINHFKVFDDDAKLPLDILNAEKKLDARTKQMVDLERTLRDAKESNGARSIFNKSMVAIKRRSSFFTSTFNLSNSFKDSSGLIKKRSNSEENAKKTQLITLEEQLNDLKKMHFKEIELLTRRVSEKREAIEKLDELSESIVKLHRDMEVSAQLHRAETDTLTNKILELNGMKDCHIQVLGNITDLESDLARDLAKTRTLKSTLEQQNFRWQSSDMPIIKEENSATSERVSMMETEIFKLNEELETCLEQNRRLIQDNAQLRKDLMSIGRSERQSLSFSSSDSYKS